MTAPAMTDARSTSQDISAACEIGYGKPPRHTQFRKGQSGNPGGRPRRLPVERANALLLADAYRCVAIKENGRMVPVPALQAILRSQIELAINGNYQAQRDVLKAVQDLEILKSVGAYDETDVDDEPDVDGETDLDDETDVDDETDEVGEDGEEDESRDADETGESDEEDETKPAARYAGNPSPSSGRVDASAASGRVGMRQHRSAAPPGACGATLPHSPSKTGVNALMDGEGSEGDETGSDATGAAVTAAPDPAPPENGAASPVTAAPAAPRVPAALRRSASPPSRRRTPALAGSRRGRRHAVTTERATGGGPAAREGGRIPRENSRPAENSGKIPC
jgi:uncharacterized protein DUF5681